MKKEQSVVEFYVACNRLKNMLRAGWEVWGVEEIRRIRDTVERQRLQRDGCDREM